MKNFSASFFVTILLLMLIGLNSCKRQEPPVADFSASVYIIEPGNSVQFTDLSTNEAESWEWSFQGGDITSSTLQNPIISYSQIGIYSVTLIAANQAGTGELTKTGIIIVTENVNSLPPDAIFSANKIIIQTGDTVIFEDLSTYSPNQWQWNFVGGNPSNSIVQNPRVVYNTAGVYEVKLVVKNEHGKDSLEINNYINVVDLLPNTIIDYDGNIYDIITIGTQQWMKKNIKVTHYADGRQITNVLDNSEWILFDDFSYDDAFCYYNNDINYARNFGALYNWAAAMGDNVALNTSSQIRGICPYGWHLPSDDEWKQLEMYIGMSQQDADALGWRGVFEGKTLKAYSSIWNVNTGTDNYGFAAMPNGKRSNVDGDFHSISHYAYWWTSTELDSNNAYQRIIYGATDNILRETYNKGNALGVRCIKD